LDDPLVDGDEAAHRARPRRSVRVPKRFAPGVGRRSAGVWLAPARGKRGVREVPGRGHRAYGRVPRGRARGAWRRDSREARTRVQAAARTRQCGRQGPSHRETTPLARS
jgi:hypothetical protein